MAAYTGIKAILRNFRSKLRAELKTNPAWKITYCVRTISPAVAIPANSVADIDTGVKCGSDTHVIFRYATGVPFCGNFFAKDGTIRLTLCNPYTWDISVSKVWFYTFPESALEYDVQS